MKIDRLLAEHQLLVTTAESCTGGLSLAQKRSSDFREEMNKFLQKTQRRE